jgi:hypothetical protein
LTALHERHQVELSKASKEVEIPPQNVSIYSSQAAASVVHLDTAHASNPQPIETSPRFRSLENFPKAFASMAFRRIAVKKSPVGRGSFQAEDLEGALAVAYESLTSYGGSA